MSMKAPPYANKPYGNYKLKIEDKDKAHLIMVFSLNPYSIRKHVFVFESTEEPIKVYSLKDKKFYFIKLKDLTYTDLIYYQNEWWNLGRISENKKGYSKGEVYDYI